MPDIMMDLLGSMLPAPEYATKEYVQARIAEAMNTAGSGPSVVLEHATFTANGSYQPDPGKAWDEVVVSVPADTLQADFVTIRSERLIAGANSVSNTVNLLTYLASLKSIAGLIFAFSIEPKSTYAYNEIGAGQCAIISNTNEAFTYRYRSGWAKIAWGNTAYDAVLPEGTNLTIFTVDTVMPT